MRRIAIILAVCALTAADLSAEGRDASPPREEEDTSQSRTPLSKWLPEVLGPKEEADAVSPAEPEPAVAEPVQAPRKQQSKKRVPEPEPEPDPKLTAEQQEAEDRWWKETGDPAVAVFSRCLGEHVIDETSSGSRSSYPDFVTSAMNGRCAREFAAMAKVILDRHGQDNFARIARKLIATKFVPAVKQVVEGGAPQVIAPEVIAPEVAELTLKAELRQSKGAMVGCITGEADRLAASSTEAPERVADRVVTSCQTMAEAYLGTLEQLHPGVLRGNTSQEAAAVLDASYRPYIVQRIAAKRAGGVTGSVAGGTEAFIPQATGPQPADPEVVSPAAVSPGGEPAPGSPVPASSRP